MVQTHANIPILFSPGKRFALESVPVLVPVPPDNTSSSKVNKEGGGVPPEDFVFSK